MQNILVNIFTGCCIYLQTLSAKSHAYESSKSIRHLDDLAAFIHLQGKKLDMQVINIATLRLGMLRCGGQWAYPQYPHQQVLHPARGTTFSLEEHPMSTQLPLVVYVQKPQSFLRIGRPLADGKIVFENMFAYNVSIDSNSIHPAQKWELDARQPQQTVQNKLRLAAMADHMHVDKIAARRAALIDLLADGSPHPRAEIWKIVAAQLGEDCWGKVPQEALARDLSALRQGGIRIAYSRRAGIEGYYIYNIPL